MKTPLLLAAIGAFGLAGAAMAADKPAPAQTTAKPVNSCFFSRDWNGWKSPDEKTIYIRVHISDIWRVDLEHGSSLLTWPSSHLIHEVHGTDSVCTPLDLDLKVADDGFVTPLFVKAVTRLTKEEVALIPKKDLP
jgi:hypothetical protein